MELQGRVKLITPTQIFGQNGFQKREIVIITDEQYPQCIIFEFTQGHCVLLDNISAGEIVKIFFSIRGREWTNPQGEVKYFNSLQGWNIDILSSASDTNIVEQFIQPQKNEECPF